MNRTTIELSNIHDLARILNEVVNAIPDSDLPSDLRGRANRLGEVFERLETATTSLALSNADAQLVARAVDATIDALAESEFETRTGLDVGQARRLSASLRAQ